MRLVRLLRVAALLAVAGAGGSGLAVPRVDHAQAHDGEAAPAASALPFPVSIRPRFSLVDQNGWPVTEADFRGRPMAVFFGYGSCRSICDVALPVLAEALELMGADADRIAPVLISVDPANDSPQALARSLSRWSPRLIGLTGTEAALAEARGAFQVEAQLLATGPDGAPIIAHGSFVYLVGADGEVKTLLPPILSPERMAQLMRKYL